MFKNVSRFVTVIALLTIVLAACAPAATPTQAPAAPVTAAPVAPGHFRPCHGCCHDCPSRNHRRCSGCRWRLVLQC